MIPGSCKSDKPNNITAVDKMLSKCDCIDGNIVNAFRGTTLFSFALDKPPGPKICKDARIHFFKKINKSVLSHIIFSLEDDDHEPLSFNGGTISFT